MAVIRKTKRVRAVLDEFDHSDDAISVVDMVERFSQQMNKTSVYRILERLEQDGSLHSLLDKNGLMWYAKCSDCTRENHSDSHAHFQCNDCGKMECLHIAVDVPKLSNYKIESASLLLMGQCQDCRSAN